MAAPAPHAPAQTTLNGWQRNLLMEGVEPNPGPSMGVIFTEIANSFGDDALRIRDDLRLIETAIKKWKPGQYAYTDELVKEFFNQKTVEDIRSIVGDAACATLWREVRVKVGLEQAAVPPLGLPSGPLAGPSTALPIESETTTLNKKLCALRLNHASPSSLSEHPNKIPNHLNCHKGENPKMVPTTLLSPQLAAFYSDLNYPSNTPSHRECEHAIELLHVVNQLYKNEAAMTESVNNWFKDFGFFTARATIRNYTTDGSLTFNPGLEEAYMMLNREDKYNGCNAEVQNATYFWSFWDVKMVTKSVCPCILVTLEGSNMTLGGGIMYKHVALCERYYSIHLENNCFDRTNRERVATMLVALRSSLLKLSEYYKEFVQAPLYRDPAVDGYPHYRKCESGTIQYLSRIGKSLVFTAKLHKQEGSPQDIVVKFCTRYSEQAHRACTIAPVLLEEVKKISGEWNVVIQEIVAGVTLHEWLCEFSDSSVKERIIQMIRVSLEHLHAKGFVHGDIRANNVMVPRNHDVSRIWLIDFDWAGTQNNARYPLFMNHREIKWPNGATDGALILPQHDMDMLAQLQL